MTTHLALEIETLGLKENSVILSLGIIPFKFENKDTHQSLLSASSTIKFNVDNQIKQYNRDINKQTLAWWKTQDSIAKETNLKQTTDDLDLKEALMKLQECIKNTDYNFKGNHVFTRTPILSMPIISSICDSVNISPINTNNSRDIKTYLDYLTGSIDGFGNLKELTFPNFHPRLPSHKVSLDILRMQTVYHNLFD